jgi:hypothetical protein
MDLVILSSFNPPLFNVAKRGVIRRKARRNLIPYFFYSLYLLLAFWFNMLATLTRKRGA